jgi:hypothetical protein
MLTSEQMETLKDIALRRDLSSLEAFKEQGLNINDSDEGEKTPLTELANCNEFEAVKFLVRNGATESINKASKLEKTPFYYAVTRNNMEMFNYLIAKGTTLETMNRMDVHGFYPITIAVKNKNLQMVKYLVEYGIDKKTINEKLSVPHPAFYYAARVNYKGIIEFLKYFISVDVGYVYTKKGIKDHEILRLLSAHEYIDQIISDKEINVVTFIRGFESVVINRINAKLENVSRGTVKEYTNNLNENYKKGFISDDLYKSIITKCPKIIEYSMQEIGVTLFHLIQLESPFSKLPIEMIEYFIPFVSPTGHSYYRERKEVYKKYHSNIVESNDEVSIEVSHIELAGNDLLLIEMPE